SKQFHGFSRDFALFEIIACNLSARVVQERLLPALRNQFVNFEQSLLERPFFARARTFVCGQLNVSPFRQSSHRLRERKILILLQKRENRPALVTAKAIENLLLR